MNEARQNAGTSCYPQLPKRRTIPDAGVLWGFAERTGSVMEGQMRYSILLEDAKGVSYFEDREADLRLQDFVPPAAALQISNPLPAVGFVFLTLPVGWEGVQHRSPHRQIAAILSGSFRVEAGTGEVRVFKAGDLFWMEDTTGAGHISSAEGGVPVSMVITQLG